MKNSASSRWHGSKNGAGQLASIEKAYAFADFAAALDFARQVGELAQAQNHHPVLLVQWGSCVVRWSTHDAAHTVTARDVSCAELCDALYQKNLPAAT